MKKTAALLEAVLASLWQERNRQLRAVWASAISVAVALAALIVSDHRRCLVSVENGGAAAPSSHRGAEARPRRRLRRIAEGAKLLRARGESAGLSARSV